MLKNISRILPFFIITLLSIGGVELLYGVVEHYLLLPKKEKVESLTVTSSTRALVSKIEKHDNYQVILDRNLFESYAKAPEPQPVKENVLQGLENTSLDLVLMGTITGPAESSRAIIMAKAKKEQDIYYAGDDVGGATIKEIMRGKVILTYRGKDEILDMSEASNLRPKDSGVGPMEDKTEVLGGPSQMPRRRPIPANVRARQIAQEEPVIEENGSDQDSGPAEIEQDVVNEPEPIDQEVAPEQIEEVVPPDREEIPAPGDGEGPPLRTDKDGREIIEN